MIEMDDSQASKLMSRLETLPQEEQSQFKRIVLATALAFLAADEHKPRMLLLLHYK